MGQDQSRAPGFEFLDSGRLQPTTGNLPSANNTTSNHNNSNPNIHSNYNDDSNNNNTRHSRTASSGRHNNNNNNNNSSSRASSSGAGSQSNGNDDDDDNYDDDDDQEDFSNENNNSHQRTRSSSSSAHQVHNTNNNNRRPAGTAIISRRNNFVDPDSQMYTGHGKSADVSYQSNSSNTTHHFSHSSAARDRTLLLEQRQDERRFQFMFQTMKMCQQELEKEIKIQQQQQQQQEENSSSSSNSQTAFPTFEADFLRWNIFALLRACRYCGAFCPSFRNATLTGSSPALMLICEDCAASSSHETVNATADTVAAAVARMPGFHGSAVSGTWQIPVVNHFDALIGNVQNSASMSVVVALASPPNNGSSNNSSSSVVANSGTISTFQQHYYQGSNNSTTSNNNNGSAGNSSLIESTSTSSSSPTNLNNNNNSSPSVRYLLNALLYGHGPTAVIQGVSGTAVESCAFASVLPGLEFVALSTTCNQRESDLETVRRKIWKDRQHSPLHLAFEGRSFDDKSLMFLGSAPFRQNITHLSVKHCDRITSAGFKLIAGCFPNLRKIDFRGSSNLDLDVFQEPITEESANVLELMTVASYEVVAHCKAVVVHKNPLCYSLRSLDFSEGALQFETRVGVFGRFQGLSELSLANCENVRDSGIVDMIKQAVLNIAEEQMGLIPEVRFADYDNDDSLSPLVPPLSKLLYSFLRSCVNNNNNNNPQQQHHPTIFHTLYEHPIPTSEIESLISSYSSQVEKMASSSYSSSQSHYYYSAPSVKWISKLNLSGLRLNLTDLSIRWLCGTWCSPEEYHRLLLTVAEERISLPGLSSTSTSSSSFSLGASYGIQPSNLTSIFAEKMCLVIPREECNERNFPALWRILHPPAMNMKNNKINKNGTDEEQNESNNNNNTRRLNLLISSPRNNNDDDNDDDETTISRGDKSPTSRSNRKQNTPRSNTNTTMSRHYTFANTNTVYGDHDENENDEDEKENQPSHEQENDKTKIAQTQKNLGIDHHTSVTYGKISKMLNNNNFDQNGEEDDERIQRGVNGNNSCQINPPPTSWLGHSLRELYLSDCHSLTPFSFTLILSVFPKLEILDISGNVDGFTDAVIDYLVFTPAPTTKQNCDVANVVSLLPKTLRSLNICRCSKVGIESICKLLKANPSITEFYGSPFVVKNNLNEENDNSPDLLLRETTKHQLRILGLYDPSIALNFIKLLALEAKKKRNEIMNNCETNSSASTSNNSINQDHSLLRTLYLPSTAKLATVEAEVMRVSAMENEGRIILPDALSRMSASAIQKILRDAKHQWNCDLKIHHVY